MWTDKLFIINTSVFHKNKNCQFKFHGNFKGIALKMKNLSFAVCHVIQNLFEAWQPQSSFSFIILKRVARISLKIPFVNKVKKNNIRENKGFYQKVCIKNHTLRIYLLLLCRWWTIWCSVARVTSLYMHIIYMWVPHAAFLHSHWDAGIKCLVYI